MQLRKIHRSLVVVLLLAACEDSNEAPTPGGGNLAGSTGMAGSTGKLGGGSGGGGSKPMGGDQAGTGGSHEAGAGGDRSAGTSGTGAGSHAAGSRGGASICEPYGEATCEEGFTCLSSSHDGSTGFCKKSGTKALGQSCPTQLNHTGCVAGLVCAEEPHGNHAHPTCRRICDPLAAEPGCTGTQLCTSGYLLGGFTGACINKHEDAQTAALGEPCTKNPKKGSPCAPELGVKYHGACVPEGNGLVCRALCRMGGDGCTQGNCQDVMELGGLGVCIP